MTVDVTMPQLGETVSEGTVTRWLRQVGDVIADQEPLLEISTDKVDTEVPSPGAGTLLEILVTEDTTVPVGALLARLGSAAADGEPAPAPAPAPSANGPKPVAVFPFVTGSSHRHRDTPRVRRRAHDAGLDLATIRGTGPSGRVTTADLDRAARTAETLAPAGPTAQASAPAAAPVIDPSPGSGEDRAPTRPGVITSTATQSTCVVEVDLTAVVGGPGWIGLLAHAVVQALREQPRLNGTVGADGTLTLRGEQHLGFGIDSGAGPGVPVVTGAGDLNPAGLARRIEALAAAARAGTSQPATVATFTLIDTGSQGTLWDTPVLPSGQVGVLGVGAVTERPVVRLDSDGRRVIAIRSMAYLSLGYDHRAVGGADAARFLTAVKHRLESAQPAELG